VEPKQHCGLVAILGRPNVGKSTLLNNILGKKLSITSRKPQTTRQNLLGIHTQGALQTVFVDTPGIHKGINKALNRYMNRVASSTVRDVDLVIFIVSADRWTKDDDEVLKRLQHCECPVILALNKVDKVKDKKLLLPLLQELEAKRDFYEIIPISAKQGTNVDRLLECIHKFLPEGQHLFPDEQITNRSERYLVAETIREKLVRLLGDELPYATTVELEEYTIKKEIQHISALIWVETEGQKKIVIGKKGEQLKRIGTDARKDIEKMLEKKVFLRLWCKVKSGWSDNERALKSLGYQE